MLKKKINLKSVLAVVLCLAMCTGMTSRVMAGNDDGLDVGKVVSAEDAEMIESKMSEKNLLQHRIYILQEENIDTSTNDNALQISELEAKVEALDKEIEALGAVTPSEELLEKFILSDCGTVSSKARSIWHPSEVIDKFEDMYDISGYVTYDEDMRMQYHVIFEYNKKDPYLFKEVNGALEQGAPTISEFENIVRKTLNIYAGKFMGSILESTIPVAQFIPWEILLEEKPNLYNVLSGSEILKCEASIYTIIKFVYVYDEDKDMWKCTLSTNKVSYAYTLISPVYENGVASQIRVCKDGLVAQGQMGSAIEDAAWAFDTNITLNTCMDTFAIEYAGDNSNFEGEFFSVDLHTPNNISGMIYFN